MKWLWSRHIPYRANYRIGLSVRSDVTLGYEDASSLVLQLSPVWKPSRLCAVGYRFSFNGQIDWTTIHLSIRLCYANRLQFQGMLTALSRCVYFNYFTSGAHVVLTGTSYCFTRCMGLIKATVVAWNVRPAVYYFTGPCYLCVYFLPQF